ncbi:MAG: hypothetical protein H7Y42_06025 [Chitinophagaceae bacterium]|nr:hypothetical protein [Chitinophagaceae bacterium]
MAGFFNGRHGNKNHNVKQPDIFAYFALLSSGTYAAADIKDKSKAKLIFLSCGSKVRPDGLKNTVLVLKEAGFNVVSYVSENTAHEFHTWRRNLRELASLFIRIVQQISQIQTVNNETIIVCPGNDISGC